MQSITITAERFNNIIAIIPIAKLPVECLTDYTNRLPAIEWSKLSDTTKHEILNRLYS